MKHLPLFDAAEQIWLRVGDVRASRVGGAVKFLVGRAALPVPGHPRSPLGCGGREDPGPPLPRPFLQPPVTLPCCVAGGAALSLRRLWGPSPPSRARRTAVLSGAGGRRAVLEGSFPSHHPACCFRISARSCAALSSASAVGRCFWKQSILGVVSRPGACAAFPG